MIVLKNANVVQFSPAAVEGNQDIVVEGTEIVAVGENIAGNYPDATVKDLNGAMVTPGIVCSHNHFYSGLARGITANINPCPDFISILLNLWWRLDRAIDEPILESSGIVCVLEAIKAGCTSVIDHHASPNFIKGSLDVLRKTYEQAGLRGILCYEITDRNGKDGTKAGVEESIEFAKTVDKIKESGGRYLVEAAIGGHAPVTLDDAALAMMREAVKETGRGVHIHVAEDKYDVSYSHGFYQKDIMPRMEDFDLVNAKGLFVHGVHLEESDIEIINEHDAFLLHNARSNMNNNVGYCKNLTKVKNLALGTDGIGANMFEEIKTAYFKHKDEGGPYWPGDFLGFLHNGNLILERYFGQKFGRIEQGYKADLTIYDYDIPAPFVDANVAGHFVFAMASRDVNSVMVDGVMIYEDRKFPFDVKPIYEKASAEAQRLWDRVDALED